MQYVLSIGRYTGTFCQHLHFINVFVNHSISLSSNHFYCLPARILDIFWIHHAVEIHQVHSVKEKFEDLIIRMLLK